MSDDHVSRETPAAPAQARALFGERLPHLEHYAQLLCTVGTVRGLIGPREVPRIWSRHLLNCAVVLPMVPVGAQVADVGTGAGLPGLVWALTRPDLRVTLVEPLLRRTTFLAEVRTALGLADRVDVQRARAEDLHGGQTFDVVTSRAVAPLERLLDWSMPLVRGGGVLLALKGSSAADEVAAASGALRRHAVGDVSVVEVGVGQVDPPTTVVRVEATSSPV